MRRLLLALLTFLAAAAPAAAQDEPRTVVARHGEIELLAGDDGDAESFCIGLRRDGRPAAVSCGPPPLERTAAQVVSYTFGSRSFAGGAVPAAGTASVELEFVRGDRVRGSVTTSTGAGRHSGRLAFFLVETTGVARPPADGEEEEPVLVRRFDSAGALVGAAAGGHEPPMAQPPRTLLRRGALRVRAVATRSFAPSLLQLDRTQTTVCLEIRRPGRVGGGTCAWPGPPRPGLTVMPERGCGRIGTIVHGFAGPAATAVELTLGSGRRMRRPTFDVSGLGTPSRAVAVVAPRGEAVRSARALDAQGRTLDRELVRGAPSRPRCDRDPASAVYAFGFHPGSPTSAAPGQLVAGAAGGPRLLARDDGDHLCFGIDRTSGRSATCHLPAPDDDLSEPVTRATAARTAAAGLVPPGAATVRVVFGGGRPVTAAISDGGEYAGAYRGHVRFFLASAPGRRRVTEVQTLDAEGELVAVTPGPDFGAAPLVIARGRGYRVFGARYDHRFKSPGERLYESRGTCFGVATRGERPSLDLCMPLLGGVRIGVVACSPRRGVLLGSGPGARLELAGGGSIASRPLAVPKRLGGDRPLWLLEIPPNARARRLRVGGEWLPYPVPPPRRQCGYALDPTF